MPAGAELRGRLELMAVTFTMHSPSLSLVLMEEKRKENMGVPSELGRRVQLRDFRVRSLD